MGRTSDYRGRRSFSSAIAQSFCRGAMPRRQFSAATRALLEFVTRGFERRKKPCDPDLVPKPDPIALAQQQLDRDRSATARFPGLFERKLARMAASPLAYLRGTAPLFYG